MGEKVARAKSAAEIKKIKYYEQFCGNIRENAKWDLIRHRHALVAEVSRNVGTNGRACRTAVPCGGRKPQLLVRSSDYEGLQLCTPS